MVNWSQHILWGIVGSEIQYSGPRLCTWIENQDLRFVTKVSYCLNIFNLNGFCQFEILIRNLEGVTHLWRAIAADSFRKGRSGKLLYLPTGLLMFKKKISFFSSCARIRRIFLHYFWLSTVTLLPGNMFYS